MAMIVCPYCDIEVNMSTVEAEDGCCPECGAIITASAMTIEHDENEDGDESAEEPIEDEDEDDF